MDDIERELVRLSARYRLTGDERYRERYLELHAGWARGRTVPAGPAPAAGPGFDRSFSWRKHREQAVRDAA